MTAIPAVAVVPAQDPGIVLYQKHYEFTLSGEQTACRESTGGHATIAASVGGAATVGAAALLAPK